MSAFVVDDAHIDCLITAGLCDPQNPLKWLIAEEPTDGTHERGAAWGHRALEVYKQRRRTLTPETADAVGALLRAQNIRSVNFRYNEDEPEAEAYYQFAELPGTVVPIVVFQAIDCYEYQSCETPDWESSEACAFCDALRRKMIREIPGYGDVNAWGISRRDVFLNPR